MRVRLPLYPFIPNQCLNLPIQDVRFRILRVVEGMLHSFLGIDILILILLSQHYFAEVEPSLRLLPAQLHTWLEDIITENEKDLGLIHPVLPDEVRLCILTFECFDVILWNRYLISSKDLRDN